MSKKKFNDKIMLHTAYFCAKFVGHLNQIFIDLYVMKVWLGFTIPYMTQGKRSGSAKRLLFVSFSIFSWLAYMYNDHMGGPS